MQDGKILLNQGFERIKSLRESTTNGHSCNRNLITRIYT